MTDFLAPVYIGAAFIVVFAALGYVMDGKLRPALRADMRNALNRSTQLIWDTHKMGTSISLSLFFH